MNAERAPNAYHRRLATAIPADVKLVGKDDTARNVTLRLTLFHTSATYNSLSDIAKRILMLGVTVVLIIVVFSFCQLSCYCRVISN